MPALHCLTAAGFVALGQSSFGKTALSLTLTHVTLTLMLPGIRLKCSHDQVDVERDKTSKQMNNR